MKFILWDTNDGPRPPRDNDGNIVSDGLIGRVSDDNVYITTYASYIDDVKRNINRAPDLKVGQYVVAKFNLSGSSGVYHVYRVE